jgi:hypothetical protein
VLLTEGEADQVATIAGSPGVVAAPESSAEVAFDIAGASIEFIVRD